MHNYLFNNALLISYMLLSIILFVSVNFIYKNNDNSQLSFKKAAFDKEVSPYIGINDILFYVNIAIISIYFYIDDVSVKYYLVKAFEILFVGSILTSLYLINCIYKFKFKLSFRNYVLLRYISKLDKRAKFDIIEKEFRQVGYEVKYNFLTADNQDLLMQIILDVFIETNQEQERDFLNNIISILRKNYAILNFNDINLIRYINYFYIDVIRNPGFANSVLEFILLNQIERQNFSIIIGVLGAINEDLVKRLQNIKDITEEQINVYQQSAIYNLFDMLFSLLPNLDTKIEKDLLFFLLKEINYLKLNQGVYHYIALDLQFCKMLNAFNKQGNAIFYFITFHQHKFIDYKFLAQIIIFLNNRFLGKDIRYHIFRKFIEEMYFIEQIKVVQYDNEEEDIKRKLLTLIFLQKHIQGFNDIYNNSEKIFAALAKDSDINDDYSVQVILDCLQFINDNKEKTKTEVPVATNNKIINLFEKKE